MGSGGGFFAVIIAGCIGLGFGILLSFAGYRMFLILLPVFGFFFGLALGAQSVQALFGDGFLATTTSWVAGFFLGLIFAVLAYLFWVIAVALMAGSAGYTLTVGILGAVGLDLSVLTWILGVGVGIVFALGALFLNLQKLFVIVSTAVMGAGAIMGTMLFLFGKIEEGNIAENTANYLLDSHPFLLLVFLAVAAVGTFFQLTTTRYYEINRYNRWEEYTAAPAT